MKGTLKLEGEGFLPADFAIYTCMAALKKT